MPVTYELTSLGGRSWFVASTGSDSSGDGSVERPFRTLVKATVMASAGDSVVVRGGSHQIVGNAVSISKAGLTVTAYPGEVPVFDGSAPAATDVVAEGDLRSVSYQPIPAGVGEGLGISNLPTATFSGGQPTGPAAQRGWRCATGTSTYVDPAPTLSDPDGCSGTPVVVSGYWPDQVWVGGRALIQVADKARVVPGTFWLARQSATDQAPTATRLFLHRDDADDLADVRVSISTGNFIRATADRVAVRGLSVKRHSPTWGQYGISVTSGVDDFSLRDVSLADGAGISFKLAGGSTAGGSGLIRRATVERVTVTDGGWMGAVALYADDLRVSGARFERLNQAGEFAQSPQSGAMKATKVDRMVVSDSVIRDVKGHGIWWDQSAYDVVLARTRLENVSHTSVFFEISHRLTMVGNLVVSATGDRAAGHTAVRLAGASNVRLVGNTIIGSPVGIGVYTEPRSKSWGPESKPCAEHPVRYGQGGDANADCNVSHHSDFDLARPGGYSPTDAPNLTPGMTWRPSVDLMIDNVIAGQTAPLASGWTPCGGFAPLCVTGGIGGGYNVQIPMNTIMHSGTLMDGNVYQPAGGRIARFENASGQVGGFVAADLGQLRGAAGLASTFYGLTVETHGRSGNGWVDLDGSATSQLSAIHDHAAPIPSDAQINEWIPVGTRRYGAGTTS